MQCNILVNDSASGAPEHSWCSMSALLLQLSTSVIATERITFHCPASLVSVAWFEGIWGKACDVMHEHTALGV